jgi:hypothetical protein
MQLVNALVKADKTFDLLVIPGANHTSGGAYGERKRFDFFVRHLRGVEPPNWNTPKATSVDRPFDEVTPTWVATEFFEHE